MVRMATRETLLFIGLAAMGINKRINVIELLHILVKRGTQFQMVITAAGSQSDIIQASLARPIHVIYTAYLITLAPETGISGSNKQTRPTPSYTAPCIHTGWVLPQPESRKRYRLMGPYLSVHNHPQNHVTELHIKFKPIYIWVFDDHIFYEYIAKLNIRWDEALFDSSLKTWSPIKVSYFDEDFITNFAPLNLTAVKAIPEYPSGTCRFSGLHKLRLCISLPFVR